MPSHTKLLNSQGQVAKSRDRPNILADHFEFKQWWIEDNRAHQPQIGAIASDPKPNIFDHMSNIRLEPISLTELKLVIQRFKNNK